MDELIFGSSYTPKINPVPLTHGGGAIFLMIFALPFVAIGGYIMGAASGVFPLKGTVHVPMPVFGVVGFIFFLPGLFILLKGLKFYAFHLKLKPKRRRYQHEPWRWDYNWGKKGAKASSNQSVGNSLFGLLIISAFSVPFLHFMLTDKGFPTLFKFVMPAMFGLFYLIAFYNLFKGLKYRSVECKYQRMPFKLGENLEVSVSGLPDPTKIASLDVELRCLYTKMVTVRRGSKRERKRFFYPIHEIQEKHNPNQVSLGQLQLSIKLPREVRLSTDFVPDNYQFWELRVKASVPGIDYDYGFIVPIYA